MPTIKIPYSPMPHQTMLHESKAKQLVAVTGRQIGKTVCAVNEIIKRAILKPGTRNWYVTNDYAQAKRNVWDMFKYYTPKDILTGKPNESELSLRIVNNSRIELIGVQNAESLRGAAVHFMVNDEYADFPRNIWPTVLKPMFSTTNGDAWFLGTGKGMGNDLYDKFFDPYSEKFKLPACLVQQGKVTNVLSKYASQEAIQHAYDNDFSPSKTYFRQEYLAEFTRPYGTVYAQWPDENYISCPYDPNLPLALTFDFGVNDPTAIIWIQWGMGEFRVIDYCEESNGDVGYFAQVIKSKPYKAPQLVTGDAAGKARSITTNTSPIDEYAKYGIHIRTADGITIPHQIMTTHKYIKSLFVNKDNTNTARFRDVLLNYRYPEKKETVVNQSNEVPVHDMWSHGARALEYFFVNFTEPTQTQKPTWVQETPQWSAQFNRVNKAQLKKRIYLGG